MLRNLLYVGLVFAVVLIVPAMAAVNFTTMPDGGTNISNGTYWVAWEPIGPHVVGDTFFINGTTNLSAGTKLDYTYVAINADYCHTKICPGPYTSINRIVTVESGAVASPNKVSILINTTDFKSDDYDLLFAVDSSNTSAEYMAFPVPGVGIAANSLSSPPTQNATPSLVDTAPALPTTSPVPVIIIIGALLGCTGIVLMKKGKIPVTQTR